MTLIFDMSKTYKKEIPKRTPFFVFQKHIKINTSKLRHFFIH